MKELYEQLYNDCVHLDSFSSLAHFVGMKGRLYDNNLTRLLLIGRCTNGWESLPTETAEAFGSAAEKEMQDTGRFDRWIKEKDGKLYNKDDSYCLNKSPFWNYTKDIYRLLSGDWGAEGVWMNNIAWTNLYKVAPPKEGNPTDDQKDIQRKTCRAILKKELELYNPTHVLFATNINGWYDEFEDLLEDVKRCEKTYVRAEGFYGDVRVCVTVRPEYKKKKEFIEQVLESFGKTAHTGLL